MRTLLDEQVKVSSVRRNQLAWEYYNLNYPNMTMEQAEAEAGFWCEYLESDFHHRPACPPVDVIC